MDANNLFGWPSIQFLPNVEYEFVIISLGTILVIEVVVEKGYFVNVDLEYTDTMKKKHGNFHDNHNLKKLIENLSIILWKTIYHLFIDL